MSLRFLCSNGVWNCPSCPIQTTRSHGRGPVTVPLIIAQEAYKEYAAQYGTSQSLERLNERGGFGAEELAILLFERIERLRSEVFDAGFNAGLREGKCGERLLDRALAGDKMACEMVVCRHEWTGHTDPGTPNGPPEHHVFCKHCGMENPGSIDIEHLSPATQGAVKP